MNKKLLLIPAVALTLTAATVTAATASAQSGSNPSDLVQAIANKFHLDPGQVQQVVNDVHEQHQQKAEQNLENKIAQLVTDKKLTQSQADALIAKLKDVRSEMENLKALPMQERHAKTMQIRNDLKSWAQAQGINLSQLFPGRAWHHGLMNDGD